MIRWKIDSHPKWRTVVAKEPFGRVDGGVLFRVFSKGYLLVGVSQIQLRKHLAFRKGSKNVLDPRERVGVHLRCLVDCQLVVPTDVTVTISLHDWDYGSGPI